MTTDKGPTSSRTVWIIPATIILLVVGFLASEPIPQDPTYHAFADGRRLLSIPNFLNVISNLPFLIVGAWGLFYVHQHGEKVCVPTLRPAYVVFFVGILTTAIGSGYYHLAPGNETLIWDRLPMTIGFAGMFTIIIGEFVSVRAARSLLLPLLFIGAVSVGYWAITEASGSGDLRPYAVVQFLPMLLIPIILVRYPAYFNSKKYFWLMIGFYVIAKIFEQLDAGIYDFGYWVSGHSLKHLAASLTPAVMLYALAVRNRETIMRSAND